MGTAERLRFEAAGAALLPEELSAAVIASLLADVRDVLGFVPRAAVISTPALFELPQNHATARAGRLAGLEEVVLIQEPIASADRGRLARRPRTTGTGPGWCSTWAAGRWTSRCSRPPRAACAWSITRATTSWAARTSTAPCASGRPRRWRGAARDLLAIARPRAGAGRWRGCGPRASRPRSSCRAPSARRSSSDDGDDGGGRRRRARDHARRAGRADGAVHRARPDRRAQPAGQEPAHGRRRRARRAGRRPDADAGAARPHRRAVRRPDRRRRRSDDHRRARRRPVRGQRRARRDAGRARGRRRRRAWPCASSIRR